MLRRAWALRGERDAIERATQEKKGEQSTGLVTTMRRRCVKVGCDEHLNPGEFSKSFTILPSLCSRLYSLMGPKHKVDPSHHPRKSRSRLRRQTHMRTVASEPFPSFKRTTIHKQHDIRRHSRELIAGVVPRMRASSVSVSGSRWMHRGRIPGIFRSDLI